ncbi:MAG: Stk1 family PASTA domain-containing Ser/Thr kinase [Tyzzerella sp.]|nr:Stk1 family PASTA domain-containing Ser/Thr kinase [Tyzzerella sp.]
MLREGVMLSGRYEIMSRIGIGGMADVYKAVDRVLNRYVAIKVLKREFREDENFVKKFWTEAQSAAVLQHPNIVNVYDVAEDRGLYFIVMELVEGITLKDYIQKKGKLTSKEVIGITLQVCAGIETAHSKNIIHRDVKPQNIIISKEGKVKVTDFGIAKATSSNTISTNVMGSVHYTSPEQARGGFSDAKSDIYSLGITMYEMITGQLPFDGDSTVAIALKHLQEDIIPPSEYVEDIPNSLEQIILKCTQKSADRRYANISQLIRDLKHSLQDPDGDFVRISPLRSVADTVMITPEDLERIQDGVEYKSNYGDDYDESYDDDDEYESRRRRKEGKKKEIDPKMAKIMRVMTVIASVVFIGVFVLIIGHVAGLFQTTPQIKPGDEKYKVPNLVGMTLKQAEDACEEAGLVLSIVREEESEQYEKDYIFKQLTADGVRLPEGTKVQVYLSTGLKTIEIPDVANKSESEAITELVNAGFAKKNIKIRTENHDTVAEKKVTRTSPEAGKDGNKNSKITVYVSKGVGQTTMPSLVGRTKSEAEKALKDAGLKSQIEEVNSEEPAGQVIAQDIEEGTVLDRMTTVKYMVSAGKVKVKIPENEEFAGKTYREVVALLEEISGEFTFLDPPKRTVSAKYNKDFVVRVEQAGETVDEDATITIVLSNGPGPGTENGGATQ